MQVPAAWVLPLPEGLSLREVMIYGTAGLTAGQCVEALLRHGVKPDHGEVVVTGASGGVGSLAVAMLARAGYQVVAVTGKPAARDFLLSLGARRVIGREEVNDTTRKPLLPGAGPERSTRSAATRSPRSSGRWNTTVASRRVDWWAEPICR